MIVGQIVRDKSMSTFKIAIVLGRAIRDGMWRVCRWQATGQRWSPPQSIHQSLLEELPRDFDLTTRKGQIVSAARRSIGSSGDVHWNVKTGTRHGKVKIGGVRL